MPNLLIFEIMKGLNTTTWYAIGFTTLTALGSIITVVRQARESDIDKLELQRKLTQISAEREQLKVDLEHRDKKVEDQNKDILSLNKKLIEKSDYIANYVTGAKGFPIISTEATHAVGIAPHPTFHFILINETEWPLYDIRAAIWDFNIISSKTVHIPGDPQPQIKMSDLKSASVYMFEFPQIPMLSSESSANPFYIESGGRLRVEIQSRNQTVYEKMAFQSSGDKIYAGLQVVNKEGKILQENINPATPAEIVKILKGRLSSIPGYIHYKYITE